MHVRFIPSNMYLYIIHIKCVYMRTEPDKTAGGLFY